MDKVQFLKNFDANTMLFSSEHGYFAPKGQNVTRLFKEFDSLFLLLNIGKKIDGRDYRSEENNK